MSNLEQVIAGVLLSDGCIDKPRSGNSSMSIPQKASHRDWLESIQERLKLVGIRSSIGMTLKKDGYVKEPRKYLFLRTQCHYLFTGLRKKWYPHGRKIVPEDLQLTPLVLADWFMGDGSSCWRKDRKKRAVVVIFCTDGFHYEYVYRLHRGLGCLGCNSTIQKGSKSKPFIGYAIYLNRAKSVVNLLKVIDKYIVPSFQYKLKWPDPQIREGTEDGHCVSGSILTSIKVKEIRKLLHVGVSQISIAGDFNVHPCTINQIATKRTWSWV